MKTSLGCAALVAAVAWLCGLPLDRAAAAEAQAEPRAGVATNAPIPLSVFVSEPSGGKDPFFPLSRRRLNPGDAGPLSTQASGAGTSLLTLKGISMNRQLKLALINNVTFAEGEKASVRVGNQSVSVKCVEIRKDSVLLTVDGGSTPVELRLRQP